MARRLLLVPCGIPQLVVRRRALRSCGRAEGPSKVRVSADGRPRAGMSMGVWFAEGVVVRRWVSAAPLGGAVHELPRGVLGRRGSGGLPGHLARNGAGQSQSLRILGESVRPRGPTPFASGGIAPYPSTGCLHRSGTDRRGRAVLVRTDDGPERRLHPLAADPSGAAHGSTGCLPRSGTERRGRAVLVRTDERPERRRHHLAADPSGAAHDGRSTGTRRRCSYSSRGSARVPAAASSRPDVLEPAPLIAERVLRTASRSHGASGWGWFLPVRSNVLR